MGVTCIILPVPAMASVGEMDKARLVNKNDYSGGFSVDWPIFEGYLLAGQTHQAQAFAREAANNLKAVQLQIDELSGAAVSES